jgi:hypothetical protein
MRGCIQPRVIQAAGAEHHHAREGIGLAEDVGRAAHAATQAATADVRHLNSS